MTNRLIDNLSNGADKGLFAKKLNGQAFHYLSSLSDASSPSFTAPKKAKKIPLNEFLGDSSQSFFSISLCFFVFAPSRSPVLSYPALGSWADEMDSLPTARMFNLI
jgi:hypothetical protein